MRLRKNDRLRQLFRWLQRKYPTPYPTELKLVSKRLRLKDPDTGEMDDVFGVTWVKNGLSEIVLSTAHPRNICEESLLHEYTHAIEVRHAKIERSRRRKRAGFHDDHYWIEYGRLYRDYYEGDGWEESRKS